MSLHATGSLHKTGLLHATGSPNATGSAMRNSRFDERDEAETLRSLRMEHDIKYKRMDAYRKYGGEHFERLMENEFDFEGENSAGIDLQRICKRELKRAAHEQPSERIGAAKPAGSLEEREKWQNAFDRSMQRLMVDFRLSDAPACRLNHLDRMHDWFTKEGAKQTRKGQQGPSYLTAPRDETLPAGSTKNISHAMSPTSLQLAGAYRMMPRSAR